MFCSPSVQAPMPPGTHNIVPARRLCKQYKLFRPPQSATTRRLALRPVPILHAGKRHTVKPPLRTPSFLPFFGKKGRPARRGQRPPPPSGGVSPSCRRSGKIAFGNFILGITSFLPAFDAKSGIKAQGLRPLTRGATARCNILLPASFAERLYFSSRLAALCPALGQPLRLPDPPAARVTRA